MLNYMNCRKINWINRFKTDILRIWIVVINQWLVGRAEFAKPNILMLGWNGFWPEGLHTL